MDEPEVVRMRHRKWPMVLVLLVFMMANSVSLSFIQHLVLERFCFEQFNVSVCHGNQSSNVESQVQADAAHFLLYKTLAAQLPSTLLTFKLGHWSDLHGRKLLMIFSGVGHLLAYVTYLLCSLFPHWPIWILLLASVFQGVTGSSIAFQLGFFGYIKDVNRNSELSVKISIADGISVLGMVMGLLLGPPLWNKFGYPAVFLSSVVAMGVALLGVIVFVDEENRYPQNDCRSIIRDFFSFRGFIDSAKSLVIKRAGSRRAYIFVALVTFIFSHFSLSVFFQISYMYFRLVAGWSIEVFNYYHVMLGGCSIIGFLVLLPILNRFFNLNDALLGIIGLLFSFTYTISIAFVTSTSVIFAVGIFRIPSGLVTVTTRSLVSKCVSSAEIGKLLAIYHVCDAVTSNLSSTIITSIYVATKDQLPGTIFIVCACLLILPLILYIWVAFDLRKTDSMIDNEKEIDDQSVVNK
ncbi:hypothetical protein CHUAL_008997 [Chamberlinius hualienensis]